MKKILKCFKKTIKKIKDRKEAAEKFKEGQEKVQAEPPKEPEER